MTSPNSTAAGSIPESLNDSLAQERLPATPQFEGPTENSTMVGHGERQKVDDKSKTVVWSAQASYIPNRTLCELIHLC